MPQTESSQPCNHLHASQRSCLHAHTQYARTRTHAHKCTHRWPVEAWDAVAGCAGDARDGVRFGAFIPGAAMFDAAAFGLSGAEAAAMDPQQRMLLQVWLARAPSSAVPACPYLVQRMLALRWVDSGLLGHPRDCVVGPGHN